MKALELSAIINNDQPELIKEFMAQLTSAEKLRLAKFAVQELSFKSEDFNVSPVAMQAMQNLLNDYKLKKAEAQLEASLTGDKKYALSLVSLDGYIECLSYLIRVADANAEELAAIVAEESQQTEGN